MLSGVILGVPGNITATVVGNDNILNIYIPGVETPLTLGNGGTNFVWDITNNQSQFVNPGKYYIKVEETDEFGHVNVVIKDILVVRVEQYIELKVYNSAGELVRTIRDTASAVPELADLSSMGDIVIIENNGTPVNVKYGSNPGDFVQWDGKNEDGQVVAAGNYELQLSVKSEQGSITHTSKSVVVLREDKTYLDTFEIWPNPYTEDAGSNPIIFNWSCKTAGETGEVYIRVYNVAGELVKQIKTKLETATAAWDLKAGLEHVSRGIYVAVISSVNEQGYRDMKVQKLAVVSYE